MFKNWQDLQEYLQLHGLKETMECEFKTGLPWDDLKLLVVKAALGLANHPGGGYVIIGIKRINETDRYELSGMSDSMSRTYKLDDVSQLINEFADPHVDITLEVFSDGTNNLVVIQVFEFEEMPVICAKDSAQTTRGRIYCRPHRKVESSPEPSVSEMREILESAIDKGLIKQKKRIKTYGLETNVDPFKAERGSY